MISIPLKNDTNETKKHTKEENIKYKSPEIFMIDCDVKIVNQLKEDGFNVEIGSFGKKYDIENVEEYLIPDNIELDNNFIEKDVVILDMKQKKENNSRYLESIRHLEDGIYLHTKKNQSEYNPINYNIWNHIKKFQKIKEKNSIVIVIADKEIETKYYFSKVKDGRICETTEFEKSNYKSLPFNISVEENNLETEKYVIENNYYANMIFKNYRGKVQSRCTFWLSSHDKNSESIIKNSYENTIGYINVVENSNNTKNTLIVLPRCEDMSTILNNILTDLLPTLYPEIFADFVKDTWMEKEEYKLPEIRRIETEKKQIEQEYENKLKKIDMEKIDREEKNKFLYDIISSSGTGDKLVQAIIKCLEYLEFYKVEDWDKEREEGDPEEDIHIYTDKENFFIGEVKGVNGPATEEDCNVISRYKVRNCSKLEKSRIHGVVFFNYQKNIEPNKREKLGFTKKEIKDAELSEYTLIGTYQLFKAIRLCQENIIKKEDVRKAIETPGLFNAIPKNYKKIGKLKDILNNKNVLCVDIECDNIETGDELLIEENNSYYKCKIESLMIEGKTVDKAKNGDKTGIKIDKDVPKSISTQIYLIRN